MFCAYLVLAMSDIKSTKAIVTYKNYTSKHYSYDIEMTKQNMQHHIQR